MTSINSDDYTPEDYSEASPPPVSLFQHLYQSPPASVASVAPPPATLPAASMRDERGPRFKDQARPALLQPAAAPNVSIQQEEEVGIPLASALLVTNSQIQAENRVLKVERQQWEQRLEQQLEHQRQLLEHLVGTPTQPQQQQPPVTAATNEQQQVANVQRQPLQQPAATTPKKWIRCIVIVVVVLVTVAGICGSGNCRGSDTDKKLPLQSFVTIAPIAATIDPTAANTTVAPTTAANTTVAPTTAASTTVAPTATTVASTAAVAAVAPATAAPTTRLTLDPRTVSEITSITSYINLITLSNRTLRYPSNATAEERALQWLIEIDRGTSESNTLALRQRYALSTLWFQMAMGFGNSGWSTTVTECDWDGVDCDTTSRLVTYLDLFLFGVKGRIPDDLGLLTALTRLNLFGNTFSGTIPSSMTSLTALNYLSLSKNALLGTIPTSMSSLTALTLLDLYGNALTGTIPSSIGSLKALTRLDLSFNALMGTIPSSIGSLMDLKYLFVHNNALMGTMPFCGSNQSFAFLVADCDNTTCPCCTHCCITSQDGIPIYELC